jgi:ribosomal protein S18 acetylase RimI-like enzyme
MHPIDPELQVVPFRPELRRRFYELNVAWMAAAIAGFEGRGGVELFLETNAKLTTALRLYARMGFVRQPTLRPGSEYARSDVYMIYRRSV